MNSIKQKMRYVGKVVDRSVSDVDRHESSYEDGSGFLLPIEKIEGKKIYMPVAMSRPQNRRVYEDEL